MDHKKPHTINFVDATPGTGKTEAAVRLMARHLLEDREGIVVYVAPTVELLERVRDERLIPLLRQHKANPRQLSSVHLYASVTKGKTRSGSVVASIRRSLEGSVEAGGNVMVKNKSRCILLITHAAFFRLPFKLKNKDQVDVIFDEARKCVFEPVKVELTDKEIELFEQYFRLEQAGTSEYSRVDFDIDHLIDLKALMEKFKKKRKVSAHAFGRFRNMVEALELGTTEVYCLRKATTSGKKTALKFYEVHLPSKVFFGWRSVYLMSAYLQQTQLWAMLCRGAFGLNGKVCRMALQQGSWQAVPARRNVTADYELRNITQTFIPNYKKREAAILKRYSNATIVSLTGNSKMEVTPRMLISSARLNSVFVNSAEDAKSYTQQFKEICKGNREGTKFLTSKHLKQILFSTNEDETVSEFARELRDWVYSLDKAAEAPYLWYLMNGLKVAKKWFKSKDSSNVPLLLSNKPHSADLRDRFPKLYDRVKLLPHSCHGRDDFKDHCMILFQAATNPTPEARSFYESHIPWYDYNQDHIVDTALQAATRTSIRDTNNKEPVLVVVPDPYLAKLLSARLGNAKIKFATEDYGIKPVYVVRVTKPDLSSTERSKKYLATDKGKAARKLTKKKYAGTDKGKAVQQKAHTLYLQRNKDLIAYLREHGGSDYKAYLSASAQASKAKRQYGETSSQYAKAVALKDKLKSKHDQVKRRLTEQFNNL